MDGVDARHVVEVVIFYVVFIHALVFAAAVRRFPGAKTVEGDLVALLRCGDDGKPSRVWFARFLLIHGVGDGNRASAFAPVFFSVLGSLRGQRAVRGLFASLSGF